MVEQAKAAIVSAHDVVDVVTTTLLPGTADRGFAEKLSEATHASLDRLAEIVQTPVNMGDPKQARLIGDMAQATCKLFMRAAEGEFRARRDDVLAKLLEQLAKTQPAEK